MVSLRMTITIHWETNRSSLALKKVDFRYPFLAPLRRNPWMISWEFALGDCGGSNGNRTFFHLLISASLMKKSPGKKQMLNIIVVV
jgi:hypothetical protein